MSMSNGVTGGNFATLADMKASKPRDETVLYCEELGNAKFIKKPSGYVALPGDVTLNNGEILQLQIDGEANIKWFGVSTDSDDNHDLIEKAILRCTDSHALYIPHGTFIKTTNASLSIQGKLTIRGDGKGKSIIESNTGSGALSHLNVDAGSNNITLKDFTFRVVNPNINSVAITIDDSDDFEMDGLEIDGNGGVGDRPNGIKIGDTSDMARFSITNKSSIHGCNFGLFSSNIFTGVVNKAIFTDSFYYDNSKDDLELNTSNNPTETWKFIIVSNNTFTDMIGSTGNTFALGTDSGDKIICTGNTFNDYSTANAEAIHIESFTSLIDVSNNLFNNCHISVAVFNESTTKTQITNNVINGIYSREMSDDISLFEDPDVTLLNNNIGIIAQRPTNPTGEGVNVSGNTITNCDVGLVTFCTEGNQNNSNFISLCGVALQSPIQTNSSISNNVCSHNKYCVWSPSGKTTIGYNEWYKFESFLFNTTGIVSMPEGFNIKVSGVSLASATTTVDFMDLPLYAHGTCNISVVNVDTNSVIADATCDLDIASAVLTAPRTSTYSTATLQIANPSLAISGGNLGARVFNAAGVDQNIEVAINTRANISL